MKTTTFLLLLNFLLSLISYLLSLISFSAVAQDKEPGYPDIISL